MNLSIYLRILCKRLIAFISAIFVFYSPFSISYAMMEGEDGSPLPQATSSSSSMISSSLPDASSIPPEGIMSASKMSFKIGFEFQEISHLCPWAENEITFQKFPIFRVSKNSKELWHLVIDTRDIEFVTPPFSSDEEREIIQASIESIIQACEILENLPRAQTSFETWVSKLLEKNFEIAPNDEEPKDFYTSLKNKEFHYPPRMRKPWKPLFQPQVTVQHPLEYTIPLIMSLFGSKNSLTDFVNKECLPALPFFNNLETQIEQDNYFTKENGLLFLHALTCSKLSSSCNTVTGDLKDGETLLNDMHRHFIQYKQVDAKLFLSFLSRRPFSMMWAGLIEAKKNIESFCNLHEHRLIMVNPLFKDKVKNFKFVNYGAEYYDDNHRRDLSSLSILFPKSLIESEGSVLSTLLANGILSTSMIRLFDPQKVKIEGHPNLTPATIFDNYFTTTIETVDTPSVRYTFNVENIADAKIEEIASEVDSLSPPWFSAKNDSIGAFTNAYLSKVNFSKKYGEVILEMRYIKGISTFALTQMGLQKDDLTGCFLTGENSEQQGIIGELIKQVKALVDYVGGINFETSKAIISASLKEL